LLKTFFAVVIAIALAGCYCLAQKPVDPSAIDSYLEPFIRTGNFSGQVLIERDKKIVFQKAFGFADREHQVPNTAGTRFHIASMSMQYTAAAILRLVDQGVLCLDSPVGNLAAGIPGAENITIRDLLTERSGLPDINDLPDYNEVLQHHQTPATLVSGIGGRPLLFEPGSKFLHEEHSAYNLLAMVIEKKTGLSFAAALQKLVFEPIHLSDTGVDDDSSTAAPQMAKGYQPDGVFGLKPATPIHWSAKTGNASIFTTASDHTRWVDALLADRLLKAASREAMLDASQRVGYGWFKRQQKRFDQTTYSMNGRAPGFASFLLYLPQEKTTVVIFSNIYSSATTTIGYDIAALSLGLPYETFRPSDPAPSASKLQACVGTFKFGPDFYQPNAEVTLTASQVELSMSWPSGDISPLIPTGRDHFIDRSYWENISIERDAAGHPKAIVYGEFRGNAVTTGSK
jgi:CubicO group peptidase (beta-lactamase class C family)